MPSIKFYSDGNFFVKLIILPMNKFSFICGLLITICMILVGVACKISGSAWYVWLIMLSASFVVMVKCTSGGWPNNSLSGHEQHLRCANCSCFTFSTLGLVSVLLNVINGVFGDVIILLLSLAVIWLSFAHFADKNGKLLWWLGWAVTMSGFAGLSISDILGFPSEIWKYILFSTLGALAVTLIIGLVLYVYPPIKELSDDVKEIRDAIKNSPRNNG